MGSFVVSLRTALPLALLALLVLSSACAPSTRYRPKRTDQVQLVMQGGRLYFQKGHRTLPVNEHPPLSFSSAASTGRELFSCDAQAEGLHGEAQARFQQGQQYYNFGLASLLLSIVITPGLPAFTGVAAVLFVMSSSEQYAGMARAVDAMNRHNDACASPRARRDEDEDEAWTRPPEPAPERDRWPEPEVRPDDTVPGDDERLEEDPPPEGDPPPPPMIDAARRTHAEGGAA